MDCKEIPLHVLKAMANLPLSSEDLEEIRKLESTDLIVEFGLDGMQLMQVRNWVQIEEQRHSAKSLAGTYEDYPERRPAGSYSKTYPLKESLRKIIRRNL